jgi:hypothetical protein
LREIFPNKQEAFPNKQEAFFNKQRRFLTKGRWIAGDRYKAWHRRLTGEKGGRPLSDKLHE